MNRSAADVVRAPGAGHRRLARACAAALFAWVACCGDQGRGLSRSVDQIYSAAQWRDRALWDDRRGLDLLPITVLFPPGPSVVPGPRPREDQMTVPRRRMDPEPPRPGTLEPDIPRENKVPAPRRLRLRPLEEEPIPTPPANQDRPAIERPVARTLRLGYYA